ncbi:hypothetical protein QTP81_16660 [Alteromonas sp. ASW11-36]|uniref:Uncharacterized protein n=1 Tax=Alteromonas arenosi TaxID=3055817 RepID=A0ABT7T1A9_9ALTE|nr:hypothetical protein [Alteromonas sp. ASW11-36]MDM7862240.1 hypothetical protein [Alteromonas sp. ASW11-36]
MNRTASRFTQVGDWIFEVKMVRALKVSRYGEPYTATANLTANGDQIYIDTQMTREGQDFTRKDFMAFYKFCQMLNMKSVSYDKIKQGQRYSRTVEIAENQQPKPIVRLVR